MDKDRMQGKMKQATGWTKEKAGELTDNEEMERRGEAEQTEGKAEEAVGKVKDAARDAVDAMKDKVKR